VIQTEDTYVGKVLILHTNYVLCTERMMEKSELDWSSGPIRLSAYGYDPKFISLLFTPSF
jgi:hypothetical protein